MRSGKSSQMLQLTWALLRENPELRIEITANGEQDIPIDLASRVTVNDADGRRLIPWPSHPNVQEFVCPPAGKCPDCKEKAGPYRFCNSCADNRIHAHLVQLRETDDKVWINSPYPSLYVAITPFEQLDRCVWQGWGLNQLPKCSLCHQNTIWDDLQTMKGVKCGHCFVVCTRCKRNPSCDLCSMAKRRGSSLDDFIFLDEYEPVDPEEWKKHIIPLDKKMDEVD